MKRALTQTDNVSSQNKRPKLLSAKKERKLQREIDEDLYLEITTNGEVILPTSIKKYYGNVNCDKRNSRWYTQFTDGRHKSTRHETEESAVAYVKKLNVKKGWKIKNIIYVYDGEYYCCLTHHQLMRFSLEHMNLVQDFIWCTTVKKGSTSYYATSTIQRKNVSFHATVLPNTDKSLSVDHINRITLDNTLSNLRLATRSCQSINQSLRSCNKTGITGVFHDKIRCIALWVEGMKRRSKTFSIKKFGEKKAFNLAVLFRKEKETSLSEYKFALSTDQAML